MITPENRYLTAFSDYLVTQKMVPENFLIYYIDWVRKAYLHVGKSFEEVLLFDEEKAFLVRLKLNEPAWKVTQAKQALGLYSHFLESQSKVGRSPSRA